MAFSDRIRPRIFSFACGLVLASLTTLSFSAPTASEKETARRLLAEGRSEREAGNHKEALQRFQAAHDIMRVPTTGLELARSQVQLGLLVEARDTLRGVVHSAAAPKEPAPFVRAREDAKKLDESLDSRIPTLLITLKGEKDSQTISVRLDGNLITVGALTVPLSVNPGEHRCVVEGTSTGFGQLRVAEGDHAQLEIELLAKSVNPAPVSLVAAAAAPATVAAQPPAVPPTGTQSKSTLGSILVPTGFTVAGVGLVVGSVGGILAMGKMSSAKSGCSGHDCPPNTWSDLDSARSYSTISTVGFVAAGAGLGLGILGLTMDSRAEVRDSRVKASMEPWLGLGSAGVNGRF